MKRVLVALAVLAAGAVVPAGRADAARGFSFTTAPHPENIADLMGVAADWHANFGDFRCPKTDHLDDHPDEHTCGGVIAQIGFRVDRNKIAWTGFAEGRVPEDDFDGEVWGKCRESGEAGEGRDEWQAQWYQTIHHQPQHHGAPAGDFIIEEDRRYSAWSLLNRCNSLAFT